MHIDPHLIPATGWIPAGVPEFPCCPDPQLEGLAKVGRKAADIDTLVEFRPPSILRVTGSLTVNGVRMSRIFLAAVLLALLVTTPRIASAQESATDDAALRAKAQRDADEIAKHLLDVHGVEVDLNCAKAAENARYSVETMLEVGEKNVKGGYLSAAQFNASAVPLRALLPQLTTADCEAATGNKRAFYQCMSSDYNHVLACGKAHPY